MPDPRVAALAAEAEAALPARGGTRPRAAAAPGRVNLIGEHTDYNEGFVLPMAIDRHVVAAFAPRADRLVRVRALDAREERSLPPDALAPGAQQGWSAYVGGMVWGLRTLAGVDVPGLDLALRGDVPIGAGLSSSAALELAVARAACAAADHAWDPVAMARLARRVENEYVGVASGIMDPFACAVSSAGTALLLDCRTLEAARVPIPGDAAIVVMDTGVRRSLGASAYNARVASCREAVRVIAREHADVRALRDVSPELLEAYRDRLDPLTYRRAEHVVRESRRPAAFAAALRRDHLAAAGALMDESHASLRDLYEVSSDELDAIVAAAREHPACYGARLTGAGFGGCAVALVERGAQRDFVKTVGARYGARHPHRSALYACEAVEGARLLG